jgi:hypothetical protein
VVTDSQWTTPGSSIPPAPAWSADSRLAADSMLPRRCEAALHRMRHEGVPIPPLEVPVGLAP